MRLGLGAEVSVKGCTTLATSEEGDAIGVEVVGDELQNLIEWLDGRSDTGISRDAIAELQVARQDMLQTGMLDRVKAWFIEHQPAFNDFAWQVAAGICGELLIKLNQG